MHTFLKNFSLAKKKTYMIANVPTRVKNKLKIAYKLFIYIELTRLADANFMPTLCQLCANQNQPGWHTVGMNWLMPTVCQPLKGMKYNILSVWLARLARLA
jgi:hypothetical protein